MNNPFTKHTKETTNPQTYFEHGKFAFINSLILIFAGLVGIIHSIFPFVFPFTTSTIVIKSCQKLVNSGRHEEELKKYLK